jgi:hypothetical protein
LEITVSFLGIHKREPDIYIGFSLALPLQCGPPGYIEESISVLLKSLTIPSLKSTTIPGNGERCALLSLPVNGGPGHEHGTALRNGGGKEASGERGQVESVHAHCTRALAKQGHLRAFIYNRSFFLLILSLKDRISDAIMKS